jgi:hypothetical protein
MAEIFLIKNDSDGDPLYKYKLGNFKRFSYDINSPVTPAPLPEESSDENVLVKIEGNSSQISLAWTIKEQTVDQETISATVVKTVTEHLLFFKNLFASKSIEDSFTLQIEFLPSAPTATSSIKWDGTITQIHTDTSDTENLIMNCNVKFLEGNVFTIYEIDVPSQPVNLVVTSPGAGTIDTDWDVPFDAGSNAITDYTVQYRLGTADWTSVEVGSTATILADISGVTVLPAGLYNVRVMAKSTLGLGRPSILKEVTVT